jgi:hypothetical protein
MHALMMNLARSTIFVRTVSASRVKKKTAMMTTPAPMSPVTRTESAFTRTTSTIVTMAISVLKTISASMVYVSTANL